MIRWRVFITSAAERALRGLPKDVQGYVLHEFPDILRRDPFAGAQLAGPLVQLRSLHFSVGGQPYRAAYSVDQAACKLLIHFVGHRSGFYERLRKKLAR